MADAPEEEKENKLVFIDSNVFISCSIEQLEDLDLNVLNKILEKMDAGKMSIILPENTKVETLYMLEVQVKGIKEKISKRVVCEATKSYFGEGAESVRFGWPVSDGRPKDFNKALDWLSERTGIPVVSGASKPHKKDGGVDVVVWKPFADRRTAFVIALIQCTIQVSWLPKGKDIIENLWRSRIATAGALTSLAIPFIIKTNFENWDDLRHTVNIIFDRLRLAEMLANRSTATFDKMIKWNKKEISQFVIQ